MTLDCSRRINGHLIRFMFVAFVMSACSRSVGGSATAVSIYYLPFKIETFLPVTPDQIEFKAHAYGRSAADNPKVKRLWRLVKNPAPAVFTKELVRAKVVATDGRFLYVSKDGTVWDGSTEGVVSSEIVGEIEEIVKELATTKMR